MYASIHEAGARRGRATACDDDRVTDLRALLDLETIDRNLYRAVAVVDEEDPLYGGQVAAQALRAAGLTVPSDRVAHSLHGYFLRAGEATRRTVFRVSRDRDGGSFSARRVVAVQNGEVILNMVCSFHRPQGGPAEQVQPMPDVAAAEQLPDAELPRLVSFAGRVPEQPFAHRAPWPTRFWARATADLGDDPLLHACALTYLSDIFTGVLPARDGSASSRASIDHSLWLHRPVDVNDWLLTDHHPQIAGGGRAWYTGTIYTRDGRVAASLAQETLYR